MDEARSDVEHIILRARRGDVRAILEFHARYRSCLERIVRCHLKAASQRESAIQSVIQREARKAPSSSEVSADGREELVRFLSGRIAELLLHSEPERTRLSDFRDCLQEALAEETASTAVRSTSASQIDTLSIQKTHQVR